MVRFAFALVALFALTANASAIPLTFADFVGTYRVVRCAEYLNGAPVAPSDICDAQAYPRLALAAVAGGYQIRFTTAAGDTELLAPYLEFRNVQPNFIDEARFSAAENAGVWMRRKTILPSNTIALDASAVFHIAGDGSTVLTLDTFEAEFGPARQVRRQFVLRRISP